MSHLHMTLAILAVVKSWFFIWGFVLSFFPMEMDSSEDKSKVNVYILLIIKRSKPNIILDLLYHILNSKYLFLLYKLFDKSFWGKASKFQERVIMLRRYWTEFEKTTKISE